jgi:hypothetical protein
MNSLASKITASTSSTVCRRDAAALFQIASGSSPNGQIADQQLAELVADEESTLAAALADCAAQTPTGAALAELRTIRSDITSRLHDDGVRQ